MQENLVDLDSNGDVIDDGHLETSNGIISSETQESSSNYSECSSPKCIELYAYYRPNLRTMEPGLS